ATGGGGGATGGGGGATGGGGGSFAWVSMSFSPVPGTPTVAREVVGLGRRSAGDIWVALGDGTVYRAAAGSNLLQLVPGFPAPTSSTTHADLITTADEVLLARGRDVFRCVGACAAFSDFVSVFTVPSQSGAPRAFCVRGDRVLFTAKPTGGATSLFESQRSGASLTFTEVSSDLGVDGERCFIDAGGDVLIPSASSVAVSLSGGGFSTEPVDLQGQPGARWTSLARAGTAGLMVGGGSGLRFARRMGTGWVALAPDTSGSLMTIVLPLSATEFLAGGLLNGGSDSLPTLFTSDGTSLRPVDPAPPPIEVQRGFLVGPNEVLFGGPSRSGSTYVVLHGTR
ncbi:MAG: hypothetical protein ACOZQL_14335, partial [Myxococcota bacterium]